MGRLGISIRCMEIRRLLDAGELEQAYELAENLDIERVTSVVDLKVIASVYERMKKYEEAMEVLYRSYEKKPTKMVVYRLAYLCVKTENFDDAEFFYREFVEMAPNSSDRYILRYGIDRAKGVDYYIRIAILQELKTVDYREEWGYELAKLYHKAGLYEECIRECDDLILWFGEGVIVEKAKLLKKYHLEGKSSLDAYGVFDESLTPEQVEHNREKFRFDTKDLGRQIKELSTFKEENQLKDDLERDLEKTVDLRKAMIEDSEALDLLGREVHRSWGSALPAQDKEVIQIKKLRTKTEQKSFWKNRKNSLDMEEVPVEEEQDVDNLPMDDLPVEEDWEIRESVAVQPKFQAAKLQEELAKEIASLVEEDTEDDNLVENYANVPMYENHQNYEEEPVYEEVSYEKDRQNYEEEPVVYGEVSYEEDRQNYEEEPVYEEVSYEKDRQNCKEEPVYEEVSYEKEHQNCKEEPVYEEVSYEKDRQNCKEEPVYEEVSYEKDRQNYEEEPVYEEVSYEEEHQSCKEEPVYEEVSYEEEHQSCEEKVPYDERLVYEEEQTYEDIPNEEHSPNMEFGTQQQDGIGDIINAEGLEDSKEIEEHNEIEISVCVQHDRGNAKTGISQEFEDKTEDKIGEEKTMSIFRRLLRGQKNDRQEEKKRFVLTHSKEEVEKDKLTKQNNFTEDVYETEEMLKREPEEDIQEREETRANVVKVKLHALKEDKKQSKMQAYTKEEETVTTGVVKRYMGKKTQDTKPEFEETQEMAEKIMEPTGKEEKQEVDVNMQFVWNLFPQYQQNVQICEGLLSLLHEVFNENGARNLVITSKNPDMANTLCNHIADTLCGYGVIEKTQVVTIKAEELNKMHLEQSYERLEGRVMQVTGARKITPDTVQSIMDMVKKLGNNVIVALNDGKPYMDDFMNEYKSLQRYFPHWIIM